MHTETAYTPATQTLYVGWAGVGGCLRDVTVKGEQTDPVFLQEANQ